MPENVWGLAWGPVRSAASRPLRCVTGCFSVGQLQVPGSWSLPEAQRGPPALPPQAAMFTQTILVFCWQTASFSKCHLPSCRNTHSAAPEGSLSGGSRRSGHCVLLAHPQLNSLGGDLGGTGKGLSSWLPWAWFCLLVPPRVLVGWVALRVVS